eukprot:c30324_g1_i1 orf=93-794(+)
MAPAVLSPLLPRPAAAALPASAPALAPRAFATPSFNNPFPACVSRCVPLKLLSCVSGSACRASSSDGVHVEADHQMQGGILSGEWPESFSLLNFEDLSAHYEPILFKPGAQPDTFLADVMSKIIYSASPDQLLENVDHFFSNVSGVPVVDRNLKCIGVLSKKDRSKSSKGLKSTVGEVMSSPAITLSADKTVKEAAVLMLKNKIHRIPIVNDSQQVVGIVTRTDIFTALGGGS